MHIQFNPYGALVLHPETPAEHADLKAIYDGKASFRLNSQYKVEVVLDKPKPTFKLESTPVPDNQNTKP
jgi:hypothetical protein